MNVREAPIERITPTGVKTRDAEYALDVLIFATSYDAVTGPLNRIEIRMVLCYDTADRARWCS